MEKLKVKIEDSIDQVSLLENISFYILILTAFLLPIFFIPSSSFQFQFSKIVFVSLAALVSFALWIIARLKDGRYLLPNNLVFLSAGILLFVTLISTLTSPALAISFIGQGFEVGTWANTFILFLVLFMYSALFRPKERVFYLYLALFASSILIVVFHAARFLFGPAFLGFGIFTDITSNLIGKWNDLGIFFGLVALLSLLTIELMQVSKLFKGVLWAVLVLSVISLAIVNFPTLWYVLAAVSLLYFVYAYAFKKNLVTAPTGMEEYGIPESENSVESGWGRVRRGSVAAAFLVVIALIFLTNPFNIGARISQQFNISHLEVRPNLSSTLSVAFNTVKSDPVFGAGPNRFVNEWLRFKPDGINQSIFWNTDFSFGIGFLPSELVTTGVLGFLAWLAFLASIAYLGIKYLLSPITDRLGRYLSVSSFFSSLFLWTFFVCYIPSAVILVLTFLFTGVFIASLYNERLLKPRTISFGEEPRVGFVSVLVLSGFLIAVIAFSYTFGTKFFASAYFQRALTASNGGDVATAEKYALRAVSLSGDDVYYRLLTELALNKMSALLSNTSANASTDQMRTQFQGLMGDAVRYARASVDGDKTNYQNWVELGRVYEAVVPLGIQGAYDSAKSAYDQAMTLNPQSPELYLVESRLAMANNDRTLARTEIDRALKMKTNYTEAIFLLSQIQVADGKLKDAIASVQSAAVLAPNDPTVFFQLGLLQYNNGDYRNAVNALERSVQLSPSYSNAKYFLGLSYEKLGRTNDALTQLNDVLTLNPGNANVQAIIKNIQAGRDPFANATPAQQPTTRSALPVPEPPVVDQSQQ